MLPIIALLSFCASIAHATESDKGEAHPDEVIAEVGLRGACILDY